MVVSLRPSKSSRLRAISQPNVALTKNIASIKKTKRGQVYFIRHGESTSNERNIFAGVLDVELTAFGRMQARQAGHDLKRKDVKFDAVYVSHLKRARQTCDIALDISDALRTPNIEPQLDYRIGEKSFGIFAQRNKNLLRLALGYEGFEEMLHSHNETPPSGEKLGLVYERAAQFYQERIEPHLERGENVLVVCHQYVLEPLALYLSDLPPNEYHHLKLPNGKALSRDELVQFQHKESGGTASLRKKVNDLATMWGVVLSAIAFLIGSTLKALTMAPEIPSSLFIALIVGCLAVATFYSYLDIDFVASRQKVTHTVKSVVNGWMMARWAVGLVALFSGWVYQSEADLYKVIWILFWLVPPALTAPVLSILWGGNLYPSALLSRTLSTAIPAALVAVLSIVMLPISPSSLSFFYIILGLGLAIPAIFAQVWRRRSPVESNHHSKNWKFIGIFASGIMALTTGFQFTPTHLIADIFFSTNPERSLACLQQFGIALLMFLLMRGTAFLTVLFSKNWPNPSESKDAYILLVTPNFFLWASLFSGISLTMHQDVLTYAAFWGACGFFLIPLVEQHIFMNSFTSNLLRDALRSSRMAEHDVKQLLHRLGVDNSQSLGKAELAELLRLIEDETTGQRNAEDIRPYLIESFLERLDGDRTGSIAIQDFETYLSRYGLVLDLNVA
ncbi:MAG: histidine phosphatase family protein [Cyanobacteria bacterium P01_F01_bin.150]